MRKSPSNPYQERSTKSGLWMLTFPITGLGTGLCFGIMDVHGGEYFIDRFVFALIPAALVLFALLVLQVMLTINFWTHRFSISAALTVVSLIVGVLAVHIMNF